MSSLDWMLDNINYLRGSSMSGVICDKKVQEVLTNNIYKTAIRLAMIYCWAMRKCEQNQMNTTAMKMLRWILGKTGKYYVRNVVIRENTRIKPINTFLTKKRLSWFLTRFNKIAIQGTPQMAVDKEAICLSRVYSYYPKCNFPLFYV